MPDQEKDCVCPTDASEPGRTPGSAEGDRELIEADIREKEQKGEL
jgi:hypothetical protein